MTCKQIIKLLQYVRSRVHSYISQLFIIWSFNCCIFTTYNITAYSNCCYTPNLLSTFVSSAMYYDHVLPFHLGCINHLYCYNGICFLVSCSKILSNDYFIWSYLYNMSALVASCHSSLRYSVSTIILLLVVCYT